MVSTPTRTTAAPSARGGASSGKSAGTASDRRQQDRRQQDTCGGRVNGPQARHHSRSPGSCLEQRILVRARRHGKVPQRIHVLPDPWLHPGPDGYRDHDGPLRLQRGSHRGGGVAVLRRPQTGRIRRDRRLRDVCPFTRQRHLAQALRLAAHVPGHCAAGPGPSRGAQRPWQPELDRHRPVHLPALRSRQACPRALDGHGAKPQGQAPPRVAPRASFRSCFLAPLPSWASSSPETTSARP